jgi:hypothetical protein
MGMNTLRFFIPMLVFYWIYWTDMSERNFAQPLPPGNLHPFVKRDEVVLHRHVVSEGIARAESPEAILIALFYF